MGFAGRWNAPHDQAPLECRRWCSSAGSGLRCSNWRSDSARQLGKHSARREHTNRNQRVAHSSADRGGVGACPSCAVLRSIKLGSSSLISKRLTGLNIGRARACAYRLCRVITAPRERRPGIGSCRGAYPIPLLNSVLFITARPPERSLEKNSDGSHSRA
jgi:hypothetical protein